MRIAGTVVSLSAAALVVASGCARPAAQTAPAASATPAAVAPPAPAAAAAPVMPDSIAQQNDRWAAQVTAQIAGKENLPAEQVFKDIQLLKGMPASRVVAVMNQGYARALGVSCAHCHNPTAWESNERTQKTKARGMIRMVNMINDGNKTIPEFGDRPTVVNCTVCHRGARFPMRNLPGQGGGGRGG